MRALLTILAAAALVAVPAATPGTAARTTCKGTVVFSGTKTVVVVLRGV